MYVSLGASQQSLVPVSIKLGRLNQLFLRSSGSEVGFGEHGGVLSFGNSSTYWLPQVS